MPTLLITGAASGIGAACARRLARRFTVVVADRDIARATNIADEIEQSGHQALAVEVDVADGASVKSAMAIVEQAVGPVHALFNCAGINRRTPASAITPEDWQAMLGTHVKGAYHFCQAVLPNMIAEKSGQIVNMSSDFAIIGMANAAAYATVKTALYSFTKCLAVEFAPHNIRVNALGPGPIDTELLRAGRDGENWDELETIYKARVPMGRLGQPDEVAAVLDFLLSDGAAFITGQIIHPNGGQVTW
jgi:NAD(P)-dependent dehydrogenase (short-subunit alcohol dehydrogenase family)